MHAIAGHVPEEDYAPLRESTDVIVAAAEQGDLHTYLSEDRTFHARLVTYTGNLRLVETTTQLRGQTRLRALRALADSGRLVESAQEHHQLLDLLADSDGDGAYEHIRRHIGHATRLSSTGVYEAPSTNRPQPVRVADVPSDEN